MRYGKRAEEFGMVDRPAVLFGPGEEVRSQGRTYVVSPHLQYEARQPSEVQGLYSVDLHAVEQGGGARWLRRVLEPKDALETTLRGYETNGHPGVFIETVWGSVFRDYPYRPRLPAPPGSPNSWPSGDDIIEQLQHGYHGKRYLVTNPPPLLQGLELRLCGEHLQDFYMGDASMLQVGDTMRVLHPFSEDVTVTEEHRAQRHPCAFLRGYLPVFWGVSSRRWESAEDTP